MQNKKRIPTTPVSTRDLDILAFIAVLLLLIAVAIGLYLAWINLKQPNTSTEFVI